MAENQSILIDELVGALKPVRIMRFRMGLALTMLALGASIVLSLVLFGSRGVLLKFDVAAFGLIANGLFLVLGLSASFGAIKMGMPQVGNRNESWKLACVMAALVPATALFDAAWRLSEGRIIITTALIQRELICLAIGLFLSLLSASALILWLRKGAPSSPDRAGLLVGLGSSALGIFAFGVSCPYQDIYHIGTSHTICIIIGALAGRLFVPRLIRW